MEELSKKIKMQNKVKIARQGAKPKYCLLCGKEINQISYFKCEDGIKRTGTFHYICRECDGKEFADYENPETILTKPNDLMMAEIAIKNLLLMISQKKYERELYENDIQYLPFVNIQQMLKGNELDTRDYLNDLEFFKQIKAGRVEYGFQIAYWEVLPFVCPIAVQGTFTIYKDMKGNQIIDPYDFDEKKKNQSVHLCVFPFNGATVILLFYHKRDKAYKQLWHQINSSKREDVLKYINYLVFALTDNFFFSKSISETILKDDAFVRLSREYMEQPNYGLPAINEKDYKYLSNKPVSADELPLIFDEKYAIKQ